ncbi:hypothetical protein [Sodalinema gerasimenkoae]|nr:hypothetical protein [Sodalinema gerasimenkoae]
MARRRSPQRPKRPRLSPFETTQLTAQAAIATTPQASPPLPL